MFTVKIHAQKNDSLDCKKYKPLDIYNFVVKNHEYEDVSKNIRWLEKCDRTPKYLNEKDADDFRQIGIEAEADYLIELARSASFYRDPDIEINNYLKYIEKYNLKYNKVKNEDLVKLLIELKGKKDFTKPEDCSPVNLKDKFPAVRNQDSVGWCYAFATADMIGFKTGYPVSAIDIAVNYSPQRISHEKRSLLKGELHENIEGGSSKEALDTITAKGICKESDSPSEYFGENKNIADFIKSVENPFENIYSQSSFLYAAKKEPLCLAKDSPSLKEISKVLAHSQPGNIMYNLNNQRCTKKRVSLDKEEYRFTEFRGPLSQIIKSIDDQLGKKMPTIISYNPHFLKNSRSDGSHASIAIGRRFNQDTLKCEYLIRNSWGTDCKQYAKPYSNPENCNEGNIWVAQEILYRNITKTTSFTK